VDWLANYNVFILTCSHFNNNSLSGPIPPELGSTPSGPLLTNLLHLLLDSNDFTGTIPDTLGNLKALQILSLSNNQLVGPIPSNLTNIGSTNSTLQQLRVSNNQLNGTIPDLSSLFSLTIVDFSNNPYAQQPYPVWLNQTTNLETIIMENCNLIDQLPADVLGYPKLEVLRLANNQLNGSLTIPALIGPNVTLVSLQNNSIMNVDQVNANGNYSGVQFEFANNPICGPNAVTKPLPSQCSNITYELDTWTSPLFGQNTCLNVSCPSGQTRNLQNCSCAHPLVVLFLIRQPSFSVITDDLMQQLQQLLYVGLNLQPQQVWITNATFTNDERVNVTILFFPFNSATGLDPSTVTNITSRLSQQNVTVGSTFSPYSVILGNGLNTGKFSVHLVV
jgi:Leucine-rich repeat (LRR) protein